MSEMPVVALVGRPNVGKSALFNRILGRRQAVVADRPGVTRDRIVAQAEWSGRDFLLIDTGGMDPYDTDELRKEVFRQAQIAMDEADVICLIVDGREGIHPLDEEVAARLRQSEKPVVLVVNKAENPNVELERYSFYALGLDEPIAISAIHGTNTGDFLDRVLEKLPPPIEREGEDEEIAMALVGRPNVGKSSLLNRLTGTQRSLVHDKAGTTRDTVDSLVVEEGQAFRILDTAGMRRKAKIDDEVEFYSSLRAASSLERAHVGVLVIDAMDGVTSQDKRVAGLIEEAGLAVVVLVNKWDLIGTAKDTVARREKFVQELGADLDFMSYAPVLFLSAKTGEGCDDILTTVEAVYEQWNRRVATPLLNEVVHEAVALRPPPSYKGRVLKVLYCSQRRNRPPTFLLKVNSTDLIHFSYERYLENQLRDAFGFVGTPIHLKFGRK
ncbi:MAG: ribosome biogenesis GTPase Der [Candidatus Eremiobacteraeota bacterium]|nr:ribosome biogenesis GTPase Der [Candidatus Eremiobacteraeota bacterium]